LIGRNAFTVTADMSGDRESLNLSITGPHGAGIMLARPRALSLAGVIPGPGPTEGDKGVDGGVLPGPGLADGRVLPGPGPVDGRVLPGPGPPDGRVLPGPSSFDGRVLPGPPPASPGQDSDSGGLVIEDQEQQTEPDTGTGPARVSSQAGSVTTLTTPTLTPTTLRNIEQMFADRDPHEPPFHHQNAAGFVPPIISPTSGNSYLPMGQITPLNCHRTNVSLNYNHGDESSGSPMSDSPSPPPKPATPTLNPAPRPLRPNHLALARGPPPPLTPTKRQPGVLPLLVPPPSSPSLLTTPVVPSPSLLTTPVVPEQGEDVQEEPSDLSITVRKQPVKEEDMEVEADEERPTSNGIHTAHTTTNTIHLLERQQNGTSAVSLSSPTFHTLDRHKLDMMDKFLKAVAAHPPHILAEAESKPPVNTFLSDRQSEPSEEGRRVGGRKASFCASDEEEKKRALRRERNKQAAARCRKRRMDLTSSLQIEVDQWEDKVRSLKEELLQLESQKKGLEAVLKRHHGPCKLAKSEAAET